MPLIIVNYSSRRRKSGEKVHSHASPKEKKSVPHLKKKEQIGKTNALVMLPPPPQSKAMDGTCLHQQPPNHHFEGNFVKFVTLRIRSHHLAA